MEPQHQALLDPSKFSVWNCFKKHLLLSLLVGGILVLLGLIACMIIYVSSSSVDPDGANKTLSTGMTFVFAISGAVFIVMLFGGFYNELWTAAVFIELRRTEYEKNASLPPIERNWNAWFLSQAQDPCSMRRIDTSNHRLPRNHAGVDGGYNAGLQVMASTIATTV